MISFFRLMWRLPRRMAVAGIEFYQRFFSPDHSAWGKQYFPYGYCKFTPSCSEYGKQAIQKKGLFRGGFKAVFRILRCNPCSKGGADFV